MNHRLNRLFPYVLILGVLILLVGIIAIPTGLGVIISFFNYTLRPERFFTGITNYMKVFRDVLFWNALKNNFIYVFSAVSLELVTGFWIAVLLSRRFLGQKLWVSLILAPYTISSVVSVVVWKYMFNTSYGIINYFLSFLGIHSINWLGDPVFAFISAVIIDVWKESPFMTIILYAAMTTVPRELYESAHIDGASFWDCLWKITLPTIRPAIFVVLIFRTIFVFRTFDIPWILTRGGPANSTELLAILTYKYGFVYWDFGRAAAIGVIMLVITLLFSSVYIKGVQKGGSF